MMARTVGHKDQNITELSRVEGAIANGTTVIGVVSAHKLGEMMATSEADVAPTTDS